LPQSPSVLTINDEHGGIGDASASDILRTAAIVGHMLQGHLAEDECAGRNGDPRLAVRRDDRVVFVPGELRFGETAGWFAAQFRPTAQLQAQRGGRLVEGLANICGG